MGRWTKDVRLVERFGLLPQRESMLEGARISRVQTASQAAWFLTAGAV
jgi:hypothetical protein